MRPTITESIQRNICAECGAPDATPHSGDWVPYCEECKKDHAKKEKDE